MFAIDLGGHPAPLRNRAELPRHLEGVLVLPAPVLLRLLRVLLDLMLPNTAIRDRPGSFDGRRVLGGIKADVCNKTPIFRRLMESRSKIQN